MFCLAKVIQDTFAQTITLFVNDILMRGMAPGYALNAASPLAYLCKLTSLCTQSVTERSRVHVRRVSDSSQEVSAKL
jgi:hypothetical protein